MRKLSHALSWLLRHGALNAGVPLTADGYVPVESVLNCQHPKFGKIKWTVEDLLQVVATNDKKRFKVDERLKSEFYPDGSITSDEKILCIRANQGHSICTIDPNLLLTKLSPEQLSAIPTIVHGTYEDAWNQHIRVEGLKCMGRNHIHFATGLPHEGDVISGMRRSCQVLIYIHAEKCARNGIVFYKSDNGVLLTHGIQGVLPVEYFSHVTSCSGSVLLDQRSHTSGTTSLDQKDESPSLTL